MPDAGTGNTSNLLDSFDQRASGFDLLPVNPDMQHRIHFGGDLELARLSPID